MKKSPFKQSIMQNNLMESKNKKNDTGNNGNEQFL